MAKKPSLTWIPVGERTPYWSPDEAAECLPGIDGPAAGELWSWVGKAETLKQCWTKLSTETRRQVMLGWKALDEETALIEAGIAAGLTDTEIAESLREAR